MPGLNFVGTGSSDQLRDELKRQREEKVQRVKKFKNKKARQAAQRATAVLADLGLTRAERRALGKRAKIGKVQKPKNYRWQPTAPVESLETEP